MSFSPPSNRFAKQRRIPAKGRAVVGERKRHQPATAERTRHLHHRKAAHHAPVAGPLSEDEGRIAIRCRHSRGPRGKVERGRGRAPADKVEPPWIVRPALSKRDAGCVVAHYMEASWAEGLQKWACSPEPGANAHFRRGS